MRGGWDLAVLCQQRRWRFVLNLVDHLPRDSAYGDAVANDEELAAMVSSGGGGSEYAPAVGEWSSEVELLAALYDRIGDLIATTVAVHGQKPPKVKPWPRPLTAADRVQSKRRQAAYEDIKRQLFPKGGD